MVGSHARDARNTLQEHQTTVLSNRDRHVFLSLFDADAEPNEALKKAVVQYKRQREPLRRTGGNTSG